MFRLSMRLFAAVQKHTVVMCAGQRLKTESNAKRITEPMKCIFGGIISIQESNI